tara:strand:+ start:485 stop:1024 length:540 start_codon:yes stop_codon:yes gene_type:complete
LKIKKIDISSILPIIIKIIKLIFEDVNRLAKFMFCKLYISEFTVFVRVNIESLNDLSKPILSKIKKLDKINKLKKKEINIRKEILIFSSLIFLSVLKIVLFIILFGLINFIISAEVTFKSIYNLVNFIPEVFDISDPPIIVINKKYKLKLLSLFTKLIPEFDMLLKTLIITSNPSKLIK